VATSVFFFFSRGGVEKMCYAGIAARCLAFSFDDVRLSVDALCGTGFWGLLPRPSRSLYFH
jgi:hypothetical protein